MRTSVSEFLNASFRMKPGRSSLITALAVFACIIALQKVGPIPLLGLFLLPWFIILFHRFPILLPMMWLPLFFLDNIGGGEALELDSSYTSLPILISFIDIAYFFTLIYIISLATNRRHELIKAFKKNPFLTIFLIIVLVSVAIYLPLHGKRAIGEARKFYFMFFFPILVLLTVKNAKDLRLIVLSVMAVAGGIIANGGLNVLKGSFNKDVAHSEPTLCLLFVLSSVVIFRMNKISITNRLIDYSIFSLCFGIIAITQHRTVIMAGGFGLIIMMLLSRAVMLFIFKTFIAMTVLFAIAGLVLTYLPRTEQVLIRNLSGIINPQKDGTASWRIQAWTQLLSRLSGTSLLVGEGLGSYYSWSTQRTKVKAAPHNAYVQVLLKFGLLGLLVYILLAYKFFRTALAVREKLPPGLLRALVEAGIVNFGAGHAYLLGYGFAMPMLIFFGLAMGAVIVAEKTWRSAIAGRRSDMSEFPDRPIAAYAGVWR